MFLADTNKIKKLKRKDGTKTKKYWNVWWMSLKILMVLNDSWKKNCAQWLYVDRLSMIQWLNKIKGLKLKRCSIIQQYYDVALT